MNKAVSRVHIRMVDGTVSGVVSVGGSFQKRKANNEGKAVA